MQKNQIKILVVDDDPRFSEALVQVITRAGFQTAHFRSATDALGNAKIHKFHAAVVDCLLPKISGPDLAVELRKLDTNLPVVLISGIFKDKAFVKDALKKSGAREFLTKPFDTDKLVGTLTELTRDQQEETLDPLRSIQLKPSPTPGERLGAVKATTHINGLELPYILSLLMHPATTGQVKLTNAQGKVTSIFLNAGRVVLVETPDPQSFFGVLIVERGLLTLEAIDEVVRSPNPKKRRIGERLIDANLLSPHQIKFINTEQMAIRLSRVISDQVFQMEFTDNQPSVSEGLLDAAHFTSYLSDWTMSKYNLAFFQNHYLPWAQDSILKSPRFSADHPAWHLPPLNYYPELKKRFDGPVPVVEFLMSFGQQEDRAYAVLHFLLALGFVYFAGIRKPVNSDSEKARLRRISQDIAKQTDFELLGLNSKASQQAVKKAYHDLSKMFHPDRLPPGCDPEVDKLTRDIFARITAAYNRLSEEESRIAYIKELEKGQAEKILQAEHLLDEGKRALQSGQAALAVEKLKKAVTLGVRSSELTLYYIWAKLMTINPKNTSETLRDSEEGISRIPPEDRHNALYFFVKGLFQKTLGDNKAASVNFQNAIGLNPEFIEAKRELNLINITSKGRKGDKDLFNTDLKDVVGMLFRKKK